MAGQSKQSSRNRKIEPLDWAETANSPALKGMMSFLDITSEEVRSGRFKSVPQDAIQTSEVGLSAHALGLDNPPVAPRPQSIIEIRPKARRTGAPVIQEESAEEIVPREARDETDRGSESHTGSTSHTDDQSHLGDRATAVSVSPTGSEALSVPASPPESETRTGSTSHTGYPAVAVDVSPAVEESLPASAALPIGDTRTGSDSTTGIPAPSERVSPAVSEPLPIGKALPVSETLIVNVTHPGGVTLNSSRIVLGSVPSQNRKIRKCRLSQDGHSASEEMLYRILWEEGRPETTNPLGSRVVRIGYAELANKARLHKANVRLNLASLAAKLAIEQSGDFNSRDMIAKAYRVLSYKEILERRRAAGLEFVIRQKNVIFVTESGEPIPLTGMPQRPKAKRNVRPAGEEVPRVQDVSAMSKSPIDSVPLPVGDMLTGSELPTGIDYQSDLACVSKALNTFWTVDDGAAEQLLRVCRRVRPDAEADEIAFFVLEKLELSRANRSINNPVGLILATVPQSFSGHSFDIFRQRRRESLRLAQEELVRKAEEDRMMREWMIKDATKTLENPSSSEKNRKQAAEILLSFSGSGN